MHSANINFLTDSRLIVLHSLHAAKENKEKRSPCVYYTTECDSWCIMLRVSTKHVLGNLILLSVHYKFYFTWTTGARFIFRQQIFVKLFGPCRRMFTSLRCAAVIWNIFTIVDVQIQGNTFPFLLLRCVWCGYPAIVELLCNKTTNYYQNQWQILHKLVRKMYVTM